MSSPQPSGGTMSIYTGFTRLCKGLAVVLIGGHIVVQIMPPAVSYLALIPAKTIPFAWNLFTAGYIEQSIIGVVISTVGLLFIGKLLEPIWGSREFLKFIFVVNFLTSVCVFITAISLYYVTRQELYLYLPISGFQGVLSGFLVGIKQIIPDQELSLLRIKQKYWQRKPETKLRGDPSDEFAFSTFFPEFLRRIIDPVATIFERMFCGRRSETPDQTRGYTLGGASLPGSDSIDASRRRERGARALEERLAERLAAAAARTDETRRDASENV
ncbi:UNVERIFIED_CONTAM: Rhomboid-like protein 19 [Sesamum calycinum]|uniref:Rhomboid-like protein 19 n=1 Tax=Sesamum calycinum TaxID=2727403 RepID=A0AAW2LVR3_9LAMI